MKYSEDEHYNATRDCDHDFVSLHHRILRPFDDGLRCTRCGIIVNEDYDETTEEEDDEYEDDIPDDIIEDDDDEDTETDND